MEMGKFGGRTEAGTEISEQLNGRTARRRIPILLRAGKKGIIAGKIHFLEPVEARQLTAPGSTDGVEVELKSEFQARKGDAVAAWGRVDSTVLSAHTLD
jgi:hypothetical protein